MFDITQRMCSQLSNIVMDVAVKCYDDSLAPMDVPAAPAKQVRVCVWLCVKGEWEGVCMVSVHACVHGKCAFGT